MDFMRVVSILMIIFFHLYVEVSKSPLFHSVDFAKPFGIIGVSFFVIISGGALSTSSKAGFSILSFYKKRALSIYPAFWITYITICLFYLIFDHAIIVGSDPLAIALSILGMDGYLNTMYSTYYLIGEWFLGFIIALYLMYPIIRSIYIKNKLLLIVASILISCLSFHFNSFIFSVSPFWNAVPMWNPLARLPEFIFGMLFFDFIRESKKNIYISIITSLVVIAFYCLSSISFYDNLYSIPLLCALFALTSSVYELVTKPQLLTTFINILSVNSFIAFLVHHRIIAYFMTSAMIGSINKFNFYYLLISIAFLSFISSLVLQPYANKIKNIFN